MTADSLRKLISLLLRLYSSRSLASMRSSFVLSLLAVVVPALGAPTVIPITKRAGLVKDNSYIIKLKDGSSGDTFLAALTKIFEESSPGSSVTYNYAPLLNAFAVNVKDSGAMFAIQRLGTIQYIEPDSIASISYEQGLDGLTPEKANADEAVGSSLFRRAADQGEGVTIFDIDTGVYVEHNCFEGRARWGETFGGYEKKDGNGHGTHTAGTAVGKGYGVAQKADLVAVKVLSDEGSGAYSDIIAGILYALARSQSLKPNTSVATMSLGGPFNQATNDAVKKAIDGGLHFAIAAGNSNAPADTFSPASVEEANTIGAVDSQNKKASFSNYGRFIDVWAPGVNIASAWIDGPNSSKSLSGTSMSTPYVAGILAIALGKKPLPPAELSAQLKKHAEKKVTFGLTELSAATTSTRLLARAW